MAYYRNVPGCVRRQDAGGPTVRLGREGGALPAGHPPCADLGGAEVMAVTSTGPTVDQTSHRLVFEALRRTVREGPGAPDSGGSIRYRASALLYLLLLGHPIDERGRCRSCPGLMTGLRARPCRIHGKASDLLLHYPDEALLLAHLAEELGASRVPPGSAAGTPHWPGLIVTARTDPGGTDGPPRLAGESHPDPSPTPTVPFSLPPDEALKKGRSDPNHGGAEVHPAGARCAVPHPDPGWPSVEHPRAFHAPGGQSVPRHPHEEPSVGQPQGARLPGEERDAPAGARQDRHDHHSWSRPAAVSTRPAQIPVPGAMPPPIAGWSVG
jgi:hypothetical protein